MNDTEILEKYSWYDNTTLYHMVNTQQYSKLHKMIKELLSHIKRQHNKNI